MPFEYASAVDFKEDFMRGYILEYENKMLKERVAELESELAATKILLGVD